MSHACACGCGDTAAEETTTTTSSASAGCGCGSAHDTVQLSRDDEIAELIRLRESIADRLEELETPEEVPAS